MRRDQYKQQCATLADAFLRGEVDLTAGCLDLVAYLRDAGLEDHPDGRRLQGFCSGTDAFPSARVRELWNAHALSENDAERERYIERWRDTVVSACRSLKAKLAAANDK